MEREMLSINTFGKDRIVKGCQYINMYNWYLGYMNRSSFWEIRPKTILGKSLKLLEEYFLHF